MVGEEKQPGCISPSYENSVVPAEKVGTSMYIMRILRIVDQTAASTRKSTLRQPKLEMLA